jgi:hypothetical protein
VQSESITNFFFTSIGKQSISLDRFYFLVATRYDHVHTYNNDGYLCRFIYRNQIPSFVYFTHFRRPNKAAQSNKKEFLILVQVS